ncbi:MAG: DNA polymerase/3'-5' exonuclease PolX [Planctomycetes bacterium]|nr:DNA polymerase/3'-5' exonuclease PolX [Planctomycetota bacterium]
MAGRLGSNTRRPPCRRGGSDSTARAVLRAPAPTAPEGSDVTNADIAATFEHVADLLEYRGDNAFRVRAYRNAARSIEGLVESLATVRADDARSLTDLEGIGDDLASKIETLLDTGRLPLLESLEREIPAVVFDLMRVPGLGPKKVKALVDALAIDSLAALEVACREERVRGIKGFGPKTEAAILENLAFARDPDRSRLLWHDADAIAAGLIDWLAACPATLRVEAAGSLRRGLETVGDLDILVDSRDPAAVMQRLVDWPETADVLLTGDTKTSIRGPRDVQIDLRVVPTESYGAALQYFTGSKEHNIRLRSRARDRGLSINEYGVFPLAEGEAGPPGPAVTGRTEAEVYAAVALPWIPPELREGKDEFALAERHALPQLVTLADMRGDLHMHTSDTDGEEPLVDMVHGAVARGLSYIAITDHGQRVTMARGLDRHRLLAQWEKIDRLNESLSSEAGPPIVVLKGIEVDILEKGGLDLPDDVLARADWVVASLHYGQSQPRDRITARFLEVIENPHVAVIGHPTGRLINRRPAYDVDMEAVIAAAARTGTFLEINANPWRLDLDDRHAAAARAAGVKIVISTDAHSTRGLDVMRCGILQARRAGLEAADVVNTRPLAEVRGLMKTR